MAQTIIDKHSSRHPPKPISKNWIYKFLDQHPKLDKRLSRSYNVQRAKNKDPKIIKEQFQRVQEIKEQYGILDKDIYNFNKTGFTIDLAYFRLLKVVTTTTSVRHATVIQPGDRTQVTTIEYVSSNRYIILLVIILPSKTYMYYYYQQPDILSDQTIGISNNSQTNNKLGIRFIQYFNKQTKSHTISTYCLLILDSYSSHSTPEFDQFYIDN